MRLSVFLLFAACSEYSLDDKIDNNLGADSGIAEGDTANPVEEERDENAPFAVCTVSPQTVTPPFQGSDF